MYFVFGMVFFEFPYGWLKVDDFQQDGKGTPEVCVRTKYSVIKEGRNTRSKLNSDEPITCEKRLISLSVESVESLSPNNPWTTMTFSNFLNPRHGDGSD